MRWYEGGIADAVTLSKKNGAIFVVYVEGNDENSTELTKIIDADEISQKLEGSHFVAIKIEADSVPHQQFSEIYKQVKVPSVYFIGKSGVPLEIIERVENGADFLQSIENVLQKNGTPTNPAAQSKANSDFIASEQARNVVCENGVCTLKPQSEPTTSTEPVPEEDAETAEAAQSELSPEEKLQRAKELIVMKTEAKQRESEELEKTKEIERRKVGQDVQKLKRWQQDQELKNMIEEREKEKKEDLAARQRILAQIEQDKADRAARFSTSPTPPPTVTITQPTTKSPKENNVTRLQFKLPDGSSHTHEFTSDTPLQEVRSYIKSNLNLTFANFVLATTFPKREFTGEDDSKTLQELELVPSAVLLILPAVHGTIATNRSSFTSFLWSLVAPILNVLGYLKNMVFGGPKGPGQSSTQENKRPLDTSGETSKQYPKRRVTETTTISRKGNIHRLTDKTDSDDENNTWNGNSTQQM